MKMIRMSVLALAMPLFLAACPGKKQEEPTPASTEMVPTAPTGAPETPVDPNAAPAAPSGTEGGTTH